MALNFCTIKIQETLCCMLLDKTRYCDVYLFDKLAQTQVVIN